MPRRPRDAGPHVGGGRGDAAAGRCGAVRDTVGRFVAPLVRMVLLSAGCTSRSTANWKRYQRTPRRRPRATRSRTSRAVAGAGRRRRGVRPHPPGAADPSSTASGVSSPAGDSSNAPARRQPSEAAALDGAQAVQWPVIADPAALRHAGIGDARAGIASILDAYVKMLPRVLVLVASSASCEGARDGIARDRRPGCRCGGRRRAPTTRWSCCTGFRPARCCGATSSRWPRVCTCWRSRWSGTARAFLRAGGGTCRSATGRLSSGVDGCAGDRPGGAGRARPRRRCRADRCSAGAGPLRRSGADQRHRLSQQ